MARRHVLVLGLSALAVIFSGCDWTMFGYDTSNTHSSPDTTLDTGNVPSLVFAFSATTIGQVGGSPAIANGREYVVSQVAMTQAETLEAFDASGNTNCSGRPRTCSPLWTAPLGTGSGKTSPAVANGVVYVGSSNNLQAFDASGNTNCTGTPKVCAPLWSAAVGPVDNSAPIVANGLVYVGSTDDNLYAFPAANGANCSGTPVLCSPLWRAPTSGSIESSAAVSNGVAYIGSNDDNLYAFDAAGSTGCSGAPTMCAPLWTGTTTGPVQSSPAVSNGTVYIGSNDPSTLSSDTLYAFDAAGSTGCSGSPKTCSPLWVGGEGEAGGSPAVAGGEVFVTQLVHGSGGGLVVFDAAGSTNCSGTSPKVCLPLWSSPALYPSSVAIANRLVYVPTANFGLLVKDESGAPIGPQEQPLGCTSSPVVANGKVYCGSNAYDALQSQMLVPTDGATLSGTAALDASVTGGGDVIGVKFVANGGTLSNQVVATATPTYYGWTAQWDTTSVPNGTYTLQPQTFTDTPPAILGPQITVTVSN